jgi:acyl transferase domain-containing protein/acyl-CoA synthetase (AMP-forming)/AMP-acid ligase II/acyl carrier protein
MALPGSSRLSRPGGTAPPRWRCRRRLLVEVTIGNKMPEDTRALSPTLLDLMRWGAGRYRDKVAFDYCHYSSARGEAPGEVHSRLTYHELDIKARAIASTLQRQGAAGERVLVLCPSGLDFIAGFFGCIYAGAVAVPVHPPVRNRVIGRVASIVADAQAGFVVSTAELHAELKAVVDDLADGSSSQWCAADVVSPAAAAEWVVPDVDAGTAAFLQYTSGSTSSPKGVVVTHRNLLHNLDAIRRAWGYGDDNAISVFWLPLHHDMGLIGSILEAIYVGCTSFLMPPEAFIERPMRWLEALSRHRGTITAAPNFAYELCVECSSAEERAALDLSSWSTAMCGAEPVRAATLQRFADAFRPAGFRPEAFNPVYGLAEATLLVSGASDWVVPVVRHVDGVALREHHVVNVPSEHPAATPFVGCGRALRGHEIVIVDPVTRRPSAAGEVGEIWHAGGSVAQGYWGRPVETEETFSAFLASTGADTGKGPFLRTGDLGFQLEGQLFITGRLKDLIVIRGRNYYPEDIEATAQDSHSALLRGRGAAFSVTPRSSPAEQLVVVQEVDRNQIGDVDVSEVIAAIRTAITDHYQIRPYAIVLVEPSRIPTTSSGKIRRSRCRQRFLDDDLEIFAQWHTPSLLGPHPTAPPGDAAPGGDGRGAGEIAARLVSQLSQQLGLSPTEIDTSLPFAHYGLDSIHAIGLIAALEAWLGRELSPTLAYEYPTIDLLARHLGKLTKDARAEGSDADERTVGAAETDGGAWANGPDDPVASSDEPIAIIGIGCRFPGADGPAALWRLLCDGVDAITEVPPDRWDADAAGDPLRPASPRLRSPRWGGFLDQVDQFDPQFFDISPREAARMDPQQRLLLEVAWEAMEDAGQVPERLTGSHTGVFIGISTNDYANLQLGQLDQIDAYTGTGNALSIAANRLSYFYDFRGPSMAIDTACSSSLVAIHLACRSLREGECTLAVAGGANVILSPALGINFSKAGVMAADGRCKVFDARADGYVRGEGAGIVVLKPLSRALADLDPIYAVIRGSATNQDGRTNGLMAPSRGSQEAVLAQAYRRAGLSPGAVDYIEAHGSGTSLGDAIEAKALTAILAEGRAPGSGCLVGSVKTNIGHLEAAAGVAGLIKVALALRHRAIPPSLHFADPNPLIPFDGLPLRVPQTLAPWPENGRRAVAGVSAFGFGGANAHVVLTEAPQVRVTQPVDATAEDRVELLPLSARSPEALAALAGRYELALAAGVPLADLCYTAGARRGHHDHRLAVVGDSPTELSASLAAYRQGAPRPGLSAGHCRSGQPPGVVFVFSGQGSQWYGMGQRLYAQEPVFRDALARCDDAMRPHLDGSLDGSPNVSIVAELLADHSQSRRSDIGVIQPAIFAVQVALAALWRSWGVEPEAVIGHSLGEVAAAHVAGALTLEDAAQVICGRARLLRRGNASGAMIAAELSVAEAQEFIAGQRSGVAVAACNSHRSTVLSGDPAVLTDLVTALQQRGRFCRWVDVDVASHSPQMDALRTELTDMLAGLRPVAATIPMYSTVTADLLSDDGALGGVLDGAYWVENLCSPVRFSAVVRRLLDLGNDTFLEVSPHPILLSAVREDAEDLGRTCSLLPSMRRDAPERGTMLTSLGSLYTRGQPVAWEQLHPWGGRCVAAPTYPWQRERFWLDPLDSLATSNAPARPVASDQPVWRGPIRSSVHPQTVFAEIDVGTELMPALTDHRIHGSVVIPAATLLTCVVAGADGAFGAARRSLRDVVFHRSMVLPDAQQRTVQLVLHGDPPDPVSFECYGLEPGTSGSSGSSGSSQWSLLARGTVDTSEPDARIDGADETHRPGIAQSRCPESISGPSFYRLLAEHGLESGPRFQAVAEIWRRDGEAIARLTAPAAASSTADADELIAPALDACFQVLAATLPARNGRSRDTYLPVGVSELRSHGTSRNGVWCHALLRAAPHPESDTIEGDVFLVDADGQVAVTAHGMLLQRIPDTMPATDLRDRLYELRWQPVDLGTPDQDAPSLEVDAGSWVIFGDGSATSDTVRQLLEQQSQPCVVVEPGYEDQDFVCLAPGSYRIDPAQPQHFRRLLHEAFDEAGLSCRGVVHLWSLMAAPPAETSIESLESARALVATSVLHLVQALTLSGWPDTPRLWLVTRGAQRVGGDVEAVSIAQAPLWGMGRSIEHEHPELRCSRVDLSSRGAAEELHALVQELRADTPDADVALRGSRRYVARLAYYEEGNDAVQSPQGPVGFEADATYLVTGGLGGIGRAVATWMAEQGARHLVLMGRGAASNSAQKTLDALRAEGVEVVVARGDVSRADQLAAVLESISASMPPLRGVVHSAGILDDGLLQHLDEQRLRKVMAPKVEGAWNVHALTRDAALDFFVVFSSAASLLGAAGMVHYAAANAFLDALAWHRHAEGRPALSINWGPWADVGLATRPEQLRHVTQLGVEAMPAADGVRALSHLLRAPATQVAVLYVDWAQWRSGLRQGLNRPLLADLGHASLRGGLPGDHTGGPGARLIGAVRGAGLAESRRLLECYLRDQLAGKLGLTPARLDIHLPLSRLGVDSLIAVELRAQIERDLGLVVPVVQLLDGPGVSGLADWLGDQLSSTSPAEPDPMISANTRPAQPNGAPGPPAAPQATEVAGSHWVDLLAKLPEVTDDAVDGLLRELLARRQCGPERPEVGVPPAAQRQGEEPGNQALAAREGEHDG